MTSIERLKAGKSVVTLIVPAGDALQAERSALERLAASVNVKGFRPGKAPEDVLRAKIDPEKLFEETVRLALRSLLPEVLKEHTLSPIVPPRIEAVSKDPLTLKVTFIERPPVKMKNTEKLAPAKKAVAIDQKDIDRVVHSAVAEHRTYAAADRPAAKGDRVTVRFSAVDKDGKDITGLKSESEQFILGEGRLLPGFEDALIGIAAGTEKSFPLTLPEKFPVEALRNTKATFTAHCIGIESVTTPAFDDAFAKKYLGQESAAAFRAMVEKTMKDQEEQFQRMSRERALLDAIRDNAVAELPDELIEQELRALVEEWVTRLEQQGQNVEDALKKQGKTAKQIEEELRAEAKNRWLLRLGIAKLIEERSITVSDDQEKKAIDAFLNSLEDEARAEAAQRIAAKDPLYEEVRWRTTVDMLIASLLD